MRHKTNYTLEYITILGRTYHVPTYATRAAIAVAFLATAAMPMIAALAIIETFC